MAPLIWDVRIKGVQESRRIGGAAQELFKDCDSSALLACVVYHCHQLLDRLENERTELVHH